MSQQRAQKIIERIKHLSTLSDRNDCLSRAFGSKASDQARQVVRQWMEDIFLEVHVDNMLNVRGKHINKSPKTFLMGSHLDTVVNAGKFDGILGVLLALDQAERITTQSISLPFNFEVVGFSEEEGVRFKKPYLGSMALAGTFNDELLQLEDVDGHNLNNVLLENGSSPNNIKQDALKDAEVSGYLEVHIEQGPVLDKLGLPVGLVTGIAGQQRHQISYLGEAGHAGTVPLTQRKDALLGAAELIAAVEHIALEYTSMVATVGKLEVSPNVGNVIAEKVNLSLDVRHENMEELNKAVDRMRKHTLKIAKKRQLVSYWETITSVAPVTCDHSLSETLKDAIIKSGFHVKHLMSGAGHDAVAVSAVAPVCMLFVRCKEGISHNPLESTSLEDIQYAISVCDHFFDNLVDQA